MNQPTSIIINLVHSSKRIDAIYLQFNEMWQRVDIQIFISGFSCKKKNNYSPVYCQEYMHRSGWLGITLEEGVCLLRWFRSLRFPFDRTYTADSSWNKFNNSRNMVKQNCWTNFTCIRGHILKNGTLGKGRNSLGIWGASSRKLQLRRAGTGLCRHTHNYLFCCYLAKQIEELIF